MKLYYDIHGIVKVESNINLEIPSYFKIENRCKFYPDLTVNVLEDLKINLDNFKKIGSWFYNENCIYLESYPVLWIRFKLLLNDLFGSTKLYASSVYEKFIKFPIGNIALPLSYHVNNLIELKLILKGSMRLTSACISQGNEGILLSGFSHSGKTTTAFTLLQRDENFRYLSDHATIIDGSGFAYCFPSSYFSIPPQVINKKIKLQIGKVQRIKAYSSRLIERFPVIAAYIQPPYPRIGEKVLEDRIDKKVQVRFIFLLEEGGETIEEMDKETAFRRLFAINNETMPFHVNPLIIRYSYADKRFDLASAIRKEIEILSNFVEKADCFIVRSKNMMKSAELMRDIVMKK
jgi:hypothetical protein